MNDINSSEGYRIRTDNNLETFRNCFIKTRQILV